MTIRSSIHSLPCLALFSLASVSLASGCADDLAESSDDEAGETAGTGETGVADESGDTGMDEVGTTDEGTTTDGSTETGSTDGPMDTGTDTDGGTDTTDGGTDTGGEEGGLACLDQQFLNGGSPGPDYSIYDVPIGSHCQGTNNQDITDIERVVFLGDSVTVGTPPTEPGDFYRTIVAEELAMKFNLVAPNFLWEQYDPINGTTIIKEDGDFASCSEWGARTDDLLNGGSQIPECFSGDDFNKRTLVVMTMGGNDIAAIAKDSIEGADPDALLTDVESMLNYQREALEWFVGDPNKFPNGVFVVFGNVYEFTDGTGEVLSCPAAGAAGFNSNPDDPSLLITLMNTINAEYMQIAEDTATDLVFMFEGFCGRGFKADDPSTICYRGPNEPTWFDLTCIHPTPDGHGALADMFMNVIDE